MQIVQMFQQFARDEEGANAIEYGLVAAVVAVGLVAALTTLKGSIGDFLAAVGTKIGAAIPQ